MINRVLIRIKVVQMLYSYLLTEKLFTLESQPTPPTKEKRFAYALYLQMLALMVKVAREVQVRGAGAPLADNRFIRALAADEKVRSVLTRSKSEPMPLLYPALVEKLAGLIKESALFKEYRKEKDEDSTADIKVWRAIVGNFISKDEDVTAAYGTLENYSPRGVERMGELLEATFANFSSSQSLVDDALKALSFSIDKARELYFRLLLIPVELSRLQARTLDHARHKFLVTDEDLNPNMRFVENQFVEKLAADGAFAKEVEDRNLNLLSNHELLMNSLLREVTGSQIYKDYMAAPSTDFAADCNFWRQTLKNVIFPSAELQEELEDQSVFWNDDLDIIGTFVLKTIRRFEEGEQEPILPQFKDNEDARFGSELFSDVVKNKEEYRELIDLVINHDNWETDRLAFMDVVIALTAVAELLSFPKIPVNVTINEYVELAKSYSTSKSGFFIHGILAGIINRLREDGRLQKE